MQSCWFRSTKAARSCAPPSSKALDRPSRTGTAWTATWATPSARTSTQVPESRLSEILRGPRRKPGASSRSAARSLGESAQVELDHVGVREQRPSGSGVGVLTLVEDVAPVHDLEAAACVLLDHQDRHALLVDPPAPHEDLV